MVGDGRERWGGIDFLFVCFFTFFLYFFTTSFFFFILIFLIYLYLFLFLFTLSFCLHFCCLPFHSSSSLLPTCLHLHLYPLFPVSFYSFLLYLSTFAFYLLPFSSFFNLSRFSRLSSTFLLLFLYPLFLSPSLVS